MLLLDTTNNTFANCSACRVKAPDTDTVCDLMNPSPIDLSAGAVCQYRSLLLYCCGSSTGYSEQFRVQAYLCKDELYAAANHRSVPSTSSVATIGGSGRTTTGGGHRKLPPPDPVVMAVLIVLGLAFVACLGGWVCIASNPSELALLSFHCRESVFCGGFLRTADRLFDIL